MKITFDWLKDHLKTNLKEKNLLKQLTNICLLYTSDAADDW